MSASRIVTSTQEEATARLSGVLVHQPENLESTHTVGHALGQPEVQLAHGVSVAHCHVLEGTATEDEVDPVALRGPAGSKPFAGHLRFDDIEGVFTRTRPGGLASARGAPGYSGTPPV